MSRRTWPRRSAATRSWCCATRSPPGEEAQIDYGHLGRWVDPGTGRRRKVWAFVMVLCCSRHMFVRPVLRMDQRAWTEAHVEAFAFFGGVPRRLVPDNLKHRGGQARPLRPEDQPVVCGAGRALRRAGRPGPGRASPGTRPGSSGRCPMCGTRSGAAGSSPRCRRCRPPRWPGAARWPAARPCRPLDGAAAGCRCSPRSKRRRCSRCRRGRSCWRPGRRARVGPDIHAKVGKTIYSVPWRLIGQQRRRPGDLDHGPDLPQGTVDRHPRPQANGQTHRHVALPAGEDRVPDADPDLVPHPRRRDRPRLRRRHRRRCWRSTPCSGCAPPRACSAWPTNTARPGWTPPARKAIAAGDPSYRTIKGILAAGAETDPPPPADRRRRRRRAPARPFAAVRERHHPAHHERRRHGPGHHERSPRRPWRPRARQRSGRAWP